MDNNHFPLNPGHPSNPLHCFCFLNLQSLLVQITDGSLLSVEVRGFLFDLFKVIYTIILLRRWFFRELLPFLSHLELNVMITNHAMMYIICGFNPPFYILNTTSK